MLKFITLMFLAVALGFKHSYDADHLIAVSNLLRKAESLMSSIKAGFSWAVGHMATATIITMLLYFFRESVLSFALPHFEKAVGVMLIVIGLISLGSLIKSPIKFHSHAHSHGNTTHSHLHIHSNTSHSKNIEKSHLHRHMLGIGIVHGLAGNDELLVLFTASLAVTTLGGLLAGLGMFSIGVVFGMTLFSCIFSYPLIKLHSDKLFKFVSIITGSISIIYGALIIST